MSTTFLGLKINFENMKKLGNYWLFQILGWGAFWSVNIFILYTIDKFTPVSVISTTVSVFLGILISHFMRTYIHERKALNLPLYEQIKFFVLITIGAALALGITIEVFDSYLLKVNPERLTKYSFLTRVFFSSFSSMWILLVWSFIYFTYHYIQRSQQQQLDTLKLESVVKNLELRTIKSHINPHFIFNSLNSIRALVDENPERARKAITELSNILRSSLTSENVETVPLKDELAIVKDYLALEQMRFEERLKVNMEIAPETLEEPVPPMMLQTLVENAIKHGISKQIDGGEVKVISSFENGRHELRVINTGSLQNPTINGKRGFGIKSTQDRLNLLYQGKAEFEIKDIENNKVQSKILMPA